MKPGLRSVVTVGVFDGVHLGHQAIMRIVKASAVGLNARSVVVTFDRSPEELANPAGAAPCITTLGQKLDLISEQGMDLAVVLPVNRRLMNTSAEQFISDVVREKLGAASVVVGTNFAFGKGRSGTVKLLRRMGKELGFEVIAVSPIMLGNVVVSSTAVRGLIAEGKVEKANELLGHPFALEGEVVAGEGIGRSLGYPTANIRPAERQIQPARGVYAVTVNLDGVRQAGVANIGSRPTVGGAETAVEVYVIGFSGDMYGRRLEVVFHRRLRGEVHFSNTDALKRQISRDVERALRLLG